jgi:ribonucleoside-diphosphate reductase alpha chain
MDNIDLDIKYIIKRDGVKLPFDSRRILSALDSAFQSTNINNSDLLLSLTNQIIDQIYDLQVKGNKIVTIEEVQDIVEKNLMSNGFHKVARNYILYREKQSQARQEETIKKVQEHQLKIKVSDTEITYFDPENIEQYLRRLSTGLYKISIQSLIDNIQKQIYDNIPIEELELLILAAAREHIEKHYEYSKLAARINIDNLYQDILKVGLFETNLEKTYQNNFESYIKTGIDLELLHPGLSEFNFKKINAAINPKNDLLFHYLGVQILTDRYFIRNREKVAEVIELPQWFWMRVAMGLSLKEKKEDKEKYAIEFYNILSKMDLVSSTPTLFNSGTQFSQMSSCYLNTTEDSLDSIFKLFSDNAKLSKWAGGIGSDWTNVRATGSRIKGTNGSSQGVIPFIKIFNDVALAVNQGGKRKGAMCAYLEIWHLDIEQFFELRKNTGDERRRAHDINTACWIPDLFMKRVENRQPWTLFCSADVPELHDLTGQAFEKRYTEYEADTTIRSKKLEAVDLWRKLLTMLYETGHPWVTFKDPCNIRSPQDHVGVVHSSNLCTEITLNTSKNETAVCNLASINLSNMITDKKLDLKKIEKTVKTGIRMLDNVIDNNFYPTKEAENANLEHRAIGLGLMGYQDALYKLNINFESNQNLEFADNSMEIISYFAIKASSLLAKERGSYSSFKGSKWDRKIFPLDSIAVLEKERGQKIDIDRNSTLNWDELKKTIENNGMRNSNIMAIAPTATIANISGVFPCTEPAYKNMYMKENLSGNFMVMNKSLIDDLDSLNLWNENTLRLLKLHSGSLKDIVEIPQNLKDKYKETFEIDMQWVLRSTAKRMKWIDQSASTNIFLTTQSGKALSDVYTTAWKLGLKTTYYLRTLAATQVTKMMDLSESIDNPIKKTENNSEPVNVCSILDPECEACQ